MQTERASIQLHMLCQGHKSKFGGTRSILRTTCSKCHFCFDRLMDCGLCARCTPILDRRNRRAALVLCHQSFSLSAGKKLEHTTVAAVISAESMQPHRLLHTRLYLLSRAVSGAAEQATPRVRRRSRPTPPLTSLHLCPAVITTKTNLSPPDSAPHLYAGLGVMHPYSGIPTG